MSHIHTNHEHRHGPGCGHTAIKHADHVDYLHDGHLHHMEGGHVAEHAIAESAENPCGCTPVDTRMGKAQHNLKHVHGPGCGHEAVPHADHVDYIVNGRLHHVHTGADGSVHCDDHGPVRVVKG
jgi:hypothetical protein